MRLTIYRTTIRKQPLWRFIRIAQRRLGERSAQIDVNDQSGWEELSEARHGFMNVVIAAAKKYEIEPFATLSVPRLKNFGSDEHRQFKADLDHDLYTTASR